MIRWGRSRGCCIVAPIGCLFSVSVILVFSGLALARLLSESVYLHDTVPRSGSDSAHITSANRDRSRISP
jgi:hypothetical protein